MCLTSVLFLIIERLYCVIVVNYVIMSQNIKYGV
jgi:hypothetical protein